MDEQMAVFIDFENVALWAEREFYDFEVTNLMEYLQSRGPAVVKRAYADWARFARYREAMMANTIDLIQIFSVRIGKNRADIRMAIDAFEIAMTRPQIKTFVIVSGDSDFSPLVAKLREFGRYTIGIGPRSTTHNLLVRSCDEFIYLETALGETVDLDEQSCVEIEEGRALLKKALQVHGQRGDLPAPVASLKRTMLLMNPAFNEANFGYTQFRSWLEDNSDLAQIFLKEMQPYAAPVNFEADGYSAAPVSEEETLAQKAGLAERQFAPRLTIDEQYKQVFS
ncbi:MAG: NYN domain-containing protein, partial [Anaerolineae bacterium]|nr:NYN domain-containing protein [Anaerolineae bacterium]